MPKGYPKPGPRGSYRAQSLKGSVLQNTTMLVTKLALEISEQNFVTKLNHAPHIVGVCTTYPCPMGYPKPCPGGGGGGYRPKSGGRITIEYKKVVHEAVSTF